MNPTVEHDLRPRNDRSDAFGHALLDHLEGRAGTEFIERDDGFIDVATRDVGTYFSSLAEWPDHEREAVSFASGRCLDTGCGAGRVLLELQERGLEAVGVDVSPLALEVCRRRGARDVRRLSIQDLDPSLGQFDTILMMGNNFGLFGTPSRARRLLRRFLDITTNQTRILAEVLDPYRTSDPFHLEYHRRNRDAGRLGGQLEIRVRYKVYRTEWFNYLFVSEPEMRSIVVGTGWALRRVIASAGATYVGVLERE
jgi:SAM-dependent methyltransferase